MSDIDWQSKAAEALGLDPSLIIDGSLWLDMTADAWTMRWESTKVLDPDERLAVWKIIEKARQGA